MMPANTISGAEVIDALRAAIAASGVSQRTYAQRIGVSQSYISDVLAGKRSASERVLSALGLRRIVVIAHAEDLK